MEDSIGNLIENFVLWARSAKTIELKEFALYNVDTLIKLEQEDYFGTEGLNKRFNQQ